MDRSPRNPQVPLPPTSHSHEKELLSSVVMDDGILTPRVKGMSDTFHHQEMGATGASTGWNNH